MVGLEVGEEACAKTNYDPCSCSPYGLDRKV